MKVHVARDALSLPHGEAILTRNGSEVQLIATEEYTYEAAEALIESGLFPDVVSRAELIAVAMETLGWGLARHGYLAVVRC